MKVKECPKAKKRGFVAIVIEVKDHHFISLCLPIVFFFFFFFFWFWFSVIFLSEITAIER